MRLHILSDLHIDVTPGFVPRLQPNVDAVVVAGDVCEGIGDGLAWLRRHLPPPMPILFVAGNHELYHRERQAEMQAGAGHAGQLGVAFLENTATVIDGVRFIGATLWTDYELFGVEQRTEMMQIARHSLNDHRVIAEEAATTLFTPSHARALHQQSRAFIGKALGRPHRGPTVVITHHGPHLSSVAARFAKDPLTPAFVSDLSALIERHQPALWVHGHTHVSFDYRVGQTRVICNPLGYGRENPHFDPALVVEV